MHRISAVYLRRHMSLSDDVSFLAIQAAISIILSDSRLCLTYMRACIVHKYGGQSVDQSFVQRPADAALDDRFREADENHGTPID
jgi:hypothetical protein